MSSLLTVDDLLALPEAEPDRILPYGEDPEQFGHLYLPAAKGPCPLVILLHGGCWRAQVSLSYFGQAARALSGKGVAVWSIEYRRVGNGGGWPDTFLDVAKGADFARELAAEYGLDLSRVVAVGHSAGGHLALWLAARHCLAREDELYLSDPLSLRGVVSLAGIPDLEAAFHQGVCQEMPEALLGGTPSSVPERYRQGSPAQLLPLGVKQKLVQGVLDETVPLAYLEAYRASAHKKDTVELISLAATGHYELVVPGTWQWASVMKETLDFF